MTRSTPPTERGRVALVAVTAVVCLAACSSNGGEPSEFRQTSPRDGASDAHSPTSQPEDMPTVTVDGSPYMDLADPEVWAQWGSHLVTVSVTAEREIEQTIEPGPGGGEDPMPGPSLRELDVTVDGIAWSHDRAVSPVGTGDRLQLTTSSGFDTVDGERVAVTLSDTTRMDVGQSYVVVLIDDVIDGQQVLEYMDGTAQTVAEDGTVTGGVLDRTSVSALVDVLEHAEPDDDVAPPEPEVSFDERLQDYLQGG